MKFIFDTTDSRGILPWNKTSGTRCLFSCWIAWVLVNYWNCTKQKAEFLSCAAGLNVRLCSIASRASWARLPRNCADRIYPCINEWQTTLQSLSQVA